MQTSFDFQLIKTDWRKQILTLEVTIIPQRDINEHAKSLKVNKVIFLSESLHFTLHSRTFTSSGETLHAISDHSRSMHDPLPPCMHLVCFVDSNHSDSSSI